MSERGPEALAAAALEEGWSRPRRKGIPAGDVILSVVTNLVLLLQRGETPEDGLDEVLEAGRCGHGDRRNVSFLM